MTFDSLDVMIAQAVASDQPLSAIVLAAEAAESGVAPDQVQERMAHRLLVMRQSVQEGSQRPVHSLSGLSGGRAHRLVGWLADHQPISGEVMGRAVAYAMAVAEVNAGMGCVVAAPTAGASGVLPGVLLALEAAYDIPESALVEGLLTAGGVGAVIAHRAAISGAAGGCQAEIGTASAMAAAAAIQLLGGTPVQAGHAVALTLQNLMGLVCDPVAGLVEIPCVVRNAAGVGQCFVAVDLVRAGVESRIPVDEVIDAMGQVGRMMDDRLKETAKGGIAATPTGRRLAEEVHSDWK